MFYSPEMASKRSITVNESPRPWRTENRITHCGKYRHNLCGLLQLRRKSAQWRFIGLQGLDGLPVGGDVDASPGVSCISQRTKIRSGHFQTHAVFFFLLFSTLAQPCKRFLPHRRDRTIKTDCNNKKSHMKRASGFGYTWNTFGQTLCARETNGVPTVCGWTWCRLTSTSTS